MKIKINGEVKSFDQELSLVELVEELGLNPQHLVVELNRSVVQRQDFGSVKLKDEDLLELIEFVAGG